MNSNVKLHLIESELERWLVDGRPQPDRDRVHADRVAAILRLDFAAPSRSAS